MTSKLPIIDQLLRYSEQRGSKGEGSAPLFFYNQFVVTTCRQEAKFGTITTHTENTSTAGRIRIRAP